MTIRSVAFIGKRNEPLFVYTAKNGSDASAVLYEETIIHSSLDIFEEKRGKHLVEAGGGGAASSSNMVSTNLFLGHIMTVSRSKVFGFCSNTLTKVVVVCDIGDSDESVVKDFTLASYSAFVVAVKNPFQEAGQPITSESFQEAIKSLISQYNSQ